MPSLESFPILPITDDLIVQDEPMGSKDKFWCQLPADVANGASRGQVFKFHFWPRDLPQTLFAHRRSNPHRPQFRSQK